MLKIFIMQFHSYLKAQYQLPARVTSMAVPGPLMITPGDVYTKLKGLESN